MNYNSKSNEIARIIIKTTNERKPQSVRQLIKILQKNLNLTEEEIVEAIMKLQVEGLIGLEDEAPKSRNLRTYLKTSEAIWYWMTIAAGVIAATMVFTISNNTFPWIYARNFLGIAFVLFLPGFAFTKALFPTNVLSKTSMENLETIATFVLSIVMSIVLVSIVGLLLYYSPWNLDLNTLVPSLFALTSTFATVAIVKGSKQRE